MTGTLRQCLVNNSCPLFHVDRALINIWGVKSDPGVDTSHWFNLRCKLGMLYLHGEGLWVLCYMIGCHGPLNGVSWSHVPGQIEPGQELVLGLPFSNMR